MPYCTIDDIETVLDAQALVSYTDDSDSGVPDSDVVDNAIESAESLIDSHINTKYELPVPASGLLTAVSADIAVYRIASRRGDAPEEYRKRYEDALKLLSKISEGKIALEGAVQVGDSESKAADIVVVSFPASYSGSGTGLDGL